MAFGCPNCKTMISRNSSSSSILTAQGFLVEVAKDSGKFKKITLALSPPEAGRGRPSEMAFLEPGPDLQGLFLTNQFFAVVTNPAKLGKLVDDNFPIPLGESAFQNTVTIADWTMTADVGARSFDTDYRNVMILKFCNRPLADHIANPNMWADTESFSGLPESGSSKIALIQLSQWLQNFVAHAAQGGIWYETFNQVVKDPNWRGILVLRATVNPSGIPDQARDLSTGIDFSEFEAHHFGVTVGSVKVGANGKLEADSPSSIFGLIDYVLPAYRRNLASGGDPDIPLPLPVSGTYGFTVLQWQALFENTVLKSFNSHIQLTTNELFSSEVTETFGFSGKSQSNAVVLEGTYEKQGNAMTCVFRQSTPLSAVTFHFDAGKLSLLK